LHHLTHPVLDRVSLVFFQLCSPALMHIMGTAERPFNHPLLMQHNRIK
jgi:hypothetical protein